MKLYPWEGELRSTALRVMELFMRKDTRRASNKNARVGHKSAKKRITVQWQENWVLLQPARNLLTSSGQISPHSGHLELPRGSWQWQQYFKQQLPSKRRIVQAGRGFRRSPAQPPARGRGSYESRLGPSGLNPTGFKKTPRMETAHEMETFLNFHATVVHAIYFQPNILHIRYIASLKDKSIKFSKTRWIICHP